eukprot:3166468-Prymnesium_polylepis.2
MVGCPLGMLASYLSSIGYESPESGDNKNPTLCGSCVVKVKLLEAEAGVTTPQNTPIPITHSP